MSPKFECHPKSDVSWCQLAWFMSSSYCAHWMPLTRVLVAMTMDMYALFLFMIKGFMDGNSSKGHVWRSLENVSCIHVPRSSKNCRSTSKHTFQRCSSYNHCAKFIVFLDNNVSTIYISFQVIIIFCLAQIVCKLPLHCQQH